MAVKNNNYFWIEFEQPNGVVSGLTNDYTDMYHSFDGSTWETTPNELSMGSNTLVYLRNDSKTLGSDSTTNFSYHLILKFNKYAKVGGDLSSLTDMKVAALMGLFDGNEYLVDASELILPWDTLSEYCCRGMFSYCTSLVNAPALPATTLASNCYHGMFEHCTNLTTAPELPATTIAYFCYGAMFHGCTSLTTAPELPATTLADSCYYAMFDDCTSLTIVPELPATSLVYGCYGRMFKDCTSIKYIKMLATDISATGCLNNWVENVAPTGTFVKAASADIERSINGIPEGWTVYNEGDEPTDEPTPEGVPSGCFYIEPFNIGEEIEIRLYPRYYSPIPASYIDSRVTGSIEYFTLENGEWLTLTRGNSFKTKSRVYFRNFKRDITYISYKHKLSSGRYTTIYIYSYMLFYCDYLINVGGDLSFLNCGETNLFEKAKGIVNAKNLILNLTETSQYSGLFYGQKKLVTAPELPATTLYDYCYYNMFAGCTSLTTAPVLPATQLRYYCYGHMFEGCTSLNYIKMSATNLGPLYNDYVENTYFSLWGWVANVAPTGTLVKSASNTKMPIDSCDGIPEGWTVYNEGDTDIPEPDIPTEPDNPGGGGGEPPVIPEELKQQYFWIEFRETGATISGLTNDCTDMYHSFDGSTWETTPNILSMGNNTMVCFKNVSKRLGDDSTTSFNSHLRLKFNKYAKVGGDLSSLTDMRTAALMGLFNANKYLVDASELILPWDTLSEYCCRDMFSGCYNLIKAPELPSTTLFDYCYCSMFAGCTSLTTAPELHATVLGEYCCDSMFSGCISLVNGPSILPATTFADSCYSSMFWGCTSLTTAPVLPATTLARSCYNSMFQGCTSLVNAPELPATTLAINCYSSMFWGCTSLIKAPVLPATTLASSCYNSMFQGCTSLVKGPSILPSPILERNCYSSMFNGCTSLTTAPELPATSLVHGCYMDMFAGCKKLNYIKMLSTDNGNFYSLNNWVGGVAPIGTFVKSASNTTISVDSDSGIPKGWTVYNEGESGSEYPTVPEPVIPDTPIPETPNLPNSDYFWIEFEDKDGIVEGLGNNSADFYHSFDCVTWFKTGSEIIMGDNKIVHIKNNTKTFGDYNTGYLTINFTQRGNVGGNVGSLINIENGRCQKLFQNNVNLVDASKLILPWDTLIEYCYKSMFQGCTSLVAAPELPATTLAEECYYEMFEGCTSLVIAPELPATTIGKNCYYQMFRGCTSLVIAPSILPATTLASNCYFNMFFGCTSLTTAPVLPATTLYNHCYTQMFQGCRNLNYIKMLATDISADSCLYHWVYDVAPTGTFVKHPNNRKIPIDSINGIPIGWTVTNAGGPVTTEELKQEYFWVEFEGTGGTITGLKNDYTKMYHSFDGIIWSTTPNTLSMGDNTLVYFVNESKKISGSELNLTINFNSNARVGGDLSSITDMSYRCCWTLFDDNIYLTDASELILPWETLSIECFYSMFAGCTSLIKVPKLPATTLANGCYQYMFQGCTSLTTAPALPSTTLASYCYYQMFRNCTSLNYIKMLATNISESSYLNNWVANVAPTGTFVKHPDNTTIPINSVNGIPIGWTVYNEGVTDIPEPDIPTDPDNPNPPVDPDNPGGGGGDTSGTTGSITSKTITIDGSAQNVEISIEQANMAMWVGVTIEQGGAYAAIDSYDFEESKITLEVTQNDTETIREIVILIYGIDNDSNEIEGRITVEQKPIDNGGDAPDNPGGGGGEDPDPDLPDIPDTPVDPEEPLPPADSETEPTIVVSKNQIILDNIGDSNTIQVTYVGVDEITLPDVGDGFTIEEVERVITNQGIQITYKITRVSPKRQNVQISFNGKNNSNGKTGTSNKVTLRGEPVPATVNITTIWPKKGDYFLIEDKQDCHIDFTISNFNTPYTMTYSIKDTNGAVYLRNSKETILDPDLYLTYDFKSLANNTNEPFTGTIDFTYTDELTNYNVSIPFYVAYANEGEVRVNVNSYNFDKDGNRIDTNKDMFIDAHYIKIASINDPVVDVDWFHLEDGVRSDYKEWVNGEYVVVGDSYRHNFTIDANSGPARKGTITFSGKGTDGKDYTFVLGINQEGSDTEKPIDEGYIELLQLSVILNASGEEQTFQVKYYDAQTIHAPELGGTWATVTEVSRTEPMDDVAWNGKECQSVIVTYKATAQSTTSGRQMKVKFSSDINYYDGGTIYMEKDKFIIYQLAEGSTEVQGDVVILRYSTSFTYYGTPTGWDFSVGYKDVTPETPTISESWCRIAEVRDLTNKDYDYYKEYILDVDTNESPVSRSCTITFIGNCEDGTQIKIPFRFTQEGQEEIFNEGEYANYKGYFKDIEGTLHSVSFITNPRSDTYGDIRLAGENPVIVSYSETDSLYEPIRTSNCTIKVVSSHYLMNLYTGKAQGTQVILRNEDRNIVEWCGYLQPNLYNQGFSSPIEEIEFEASDCLAGLQYFEYEYYFQGNGQPMIVSFKDIVDSIADRCGLIQDYRFTQKEFSNSDTTKIFDFKEFYISENNFYSEEGEPWTYQEVLEETCKYFGFVCFQWGESLYFIDYDRYKTTKDMVGYVYAKADRWRTRTYRTLSSSNSITEDSYRGTGGSMSLDDIFNKVSVNCNYYNVEHIIPDIFEDDFLTERNSTTITTVVNRGQEIGSKTAYNVYDHKNIKSHFYQPIVGTNIHEVEVEPTEEQFSSKTFFKDFVGGNIVDLYHLGYSDLKGRTYESKEWERFLMISQLNRPWCKGPIAYEYDTTKYWEEYNLPIMEFTQLPQIFIDNHKEVYGNRVPTTGGRVPSTKAGGFGTSSTTSRNERPTVNPVKAEHYFVISAEAAFTPDFDESYVPEGVEEKGFNKWSNSDYGGYTYFIKDTSNKQLNFAPKLTFYLEIPTEGWWNGEKWVDYETWFEVPLEELEYKKDVWYSFKNTQNKVQTNLFLGKAGYKIPLPESVESTAFMQFKIGMPKRFAHCNLGDDNGEAGNAYCLIKDLQMDIVTRNSSLLKDEDIVYENVIDDNNVIDGPEIDLKITSDNNITHSYSTVSTKYGDDMINTTNFRFYDKDGELILPEEAIIEKYVKQYSTPSLKENVVLDLTFTPSQLITDTYWNKDFVIVAQEIDYKMCSQTITLLQKK